MNEEALTFHFALGFTNYVVGPVYYTVKNFGKDRLAQGHTAKEWKWVWNPEVSDPKVLLPHNFETQKERTLIVEITLIVISATLSGFRVRERPSPGILSTPGRFSSVLLLKGKTNV